MLDQKSQRKSPVKRFAVGDVKVGGPPRCYKQRKTVFSNFSILVLSAASVVCYDLI
jgi:hypothetical protein